MQKFFRIKSKKFFAVSEQIRELYTSKFFFLEFILWIRKMPLWQLCWELLGKSLKLSLPKSINDSNYFFCTICSLRTFSRHYPAEILRFFPSKSACVDFFFTKSLFGKLLVWTRRMQLWWYSRHFLPESWKSSEQIHKLMEKNDFILKSFSFENLLWTHRVQFYLTFRTFRTEARKSLSQSQRLMGKFFSCEKVFLL